MIVKKISGRKILASLGNETIEATITLGNAIFSASVPAGISAGKYEMKKSPIDQALLEIDKINVLCQEKHWTQESLDQEISKYNFGGNSTLAVSAAFFKSQIANVKKPIAFPSIMLLAFEGGKHGNSNLSIQEFLVIEESLRGAKEDFQKIRQRLSESNIETTVGAEGGFSPKNYTNEDALRFLRETLSARQLALDVAATFSSGQPLDYDKLLAVYPLASLEDPYSDEDWQNWQEMNQKYGAKIMIVGDDLTTTNPGRIKEAIAKKAINGVVIKPNQIGTITQSFEAVKIAREGGLKIIVSHRGEETDDTWIVDFALAVNADYVKFGGLDRGERIAKYNRLAELGMT